MQKKDIVIVVPTYKKTLSYLEKISLTQLQRILGDYPKVFYAPESLEFDYGSLSAGFSVERFPDEWFESAYAYSRLMLEKGFYKRFAKYEYMLIYQLDAFVFSDKLLEFCEMGWDYIGAPVPSLTPHWHAIRTCIGNGGFSLRKIDKAIQMLEESHEWIDRNPFRDCLVGWEDMFWGYCGTQEMLDFKLPSKSVALRFSVQDNISHAYDKMPDALPFGCHAWYQDNADFWKNIITRCGYNLEQYHVTGTSSMRRSLAKQLWNIHSGMNIPILYHYIFNSKHKQALSLMMSWLEKYDESSPIWRGLLEHFICIWRINRESILKSDNYLNQLMETVIEEIMLRIIKNGSFGLWKISMLHSVLQQKREYPRGITLKLEGQIMDTLNNHELEDEIALYLYDMEYSDDLEAGKKILELIKTQNISEELLYRLIGRTNEQNKIIKMLLSLME